MISKKIYSLQLRTKSDFSVNLNSVVSLVERCKKDSMVCTSDLVLSGYDFSRIIEASEFSAVAKKEYMRATQEKTLITSLIEQIDGKFYNISMAFHKGNILYSQPKTKLFPLSDEISHITAGSIDDISIFSIGEIKCAILNSFELRFTSLWQRVLGAEVIFIPAHWYKDRKQHFEILSRALAITNQAYVVTSDGANSGMAKGSSIITPFGDVHKDDKREVVFSDIRLEAIRSVRDHINIGL